MNSEEVLPILDNWVAEAKGQRLSFLQKEIICKSWDGERYDDMEIYKYKVSYIKQEAGPKLWKLLSEVIGETVTKDTLKPVVEQAIKKRSRKSPLTKPHHRQDWRDTPDVPVFYDRTEDLSKLEQWIVTDRCKIVALWSMGGMGKTALSVKLAQQIQHQFEYVIWRSLRNAPPVENILADLIEFLCDDTNTPLPETFTRGISRLIDSLQNHRCLVVLDGIETIMETGEVAGRYREEYQDYGKLFRQIGELNHQSCLMLTTSEKSREIALLEGQKRPVRYYKLKGLSKLAAKEIFREKGLIEELEWNSIIECYEGNPLYLNIVAAMIIDLFDGSVKKFLIKGTTYLGGIKVILGQHFERISKLEAEVMYKLAIASHPITLDEVRSRIVSPVPTSQLIEAMESLGWRSLIEKRTENGQSLFSLQTVVRKYVRDRFN